MDPKGTVIAAVLPRTGASCGVNCRTPLGVDSVHLKLATLGTHSLPLYRPRYLAMIAPLIVLASGLITVSMVVYGED